jgi:hypothetical protein
MRMIFGAIGGMKFGRGNRSTRRKPTPAPLCPPQNPTWQTQSQTLDHSGGKPATNRLSYGATFFSPISSPLTTCRFTVEVFDPASTRVVLSVSSKSIFSFLLFRLCTFWWNIWILILFLLLLLFLSIPALCLSIKNLYLALVGASSFWLTYKLPDAPRS